MHYINKNVNKIINKITKKNKRYSNLYNPIGTNNEKYIMKVIEHKKNYIF